MKRSFFGLGSMAVLILALGGESHAGFTINTSGGAPAGVSYVNFNDLALGNAGGTSGGIGVTFSPGGQAVQGSLSGVYAAPFLTNSNGAPFGDSTVSGRDATTYLTTGTGSVTLIMPGPEKYFGLLWGSVDSYNSLSFYDAASHLIGTITGDQVTMAANGDQGASGSYYVKINSTDAFTTVVARSPNNAFEFDNVSYGPTAAAVPEPSSAVLLGAGLAALAFARRRRTAVRTA